MRLQCWHGGVSRKEIPGGLRWSTQQTYYIYSRKQKASYISLPIDVEDDGKRGDDSKSERSSEQAQRDHVEPDHATINKKASQESILSV